MLWGIDMAVRRGEITALIGSNGAGKTTLMRALSGLIPTQGGYYFSEGRDLTGDTAARNSCATASSTSRRDGGCSAR